MKVTRSCLTLCDPVDYTVHGILQARILEWVTFSFYRGSSQPRDWTQVSRIAGGFFTVWATREALPGTRASQNTWGLEPDFYSTCFCGCKEGSLKPKDHRELLSKSQNMQRLLGVEGGCFSIISVSSNMFQVKFRERFEKPYPQQLSTCKYPCTHTCTHTQAFTLLWAAVFPFPEAFSR